MTLREIPSAPPNVLKIRVLPLADETFSRNVDGPPMRQPLAVRSFGLRRSRYVGLAKTHLEYIFIATAINLYRIVDWLNEVPLAKTRQAAFIRLMPQIAT
ncbi:hypothetical protein [Spirosoma spitsbergense]|uniref:hypothetical protein n=1 Tax=Spirosoma spitsbergense TaxID=431554 RepID=UPI000378990F|nr:hypothetical protein [Spirosoma spitsbergense]